MSYEDGLAAVNLEMPARVPRFEPSAAEYHWKLVNRVTGMNINVHSPEAVKFDGTKAFVKAWDYGIYFASLIGGKELAAKSTNMGHADYAEEGADFDDDIRSPFGSVEEVLRFDPWETYGPRDKKELVRRFNEQYRHQCASFPTAVNMTGIYVSLMSGMIQIFGWDLLLQAAGEDPERFGDLVNRYAAWMQQYYDALAESETYAIYSHDDMVWTAGPFLQPAWYRKYIFPNIRRYWAPLRERGKRIIFVCDGNYTPFLEDIVACGNHGFWFEVFTDLSAITERYGKTHFIIGNGDARVLTFGTREQIRAEVERCMSAGKKCPGYFMCVSGHIPPNVPVENALYYDEVYRELCRR